MYMEESGPIYAIYEKVLMSYQAIHKKIDVALIQLESAISAYRDGRYIESITLAGASEKILGAICRRNKMETAVEKIANLPLIVAIEPDQSKRIAILNHARNCLKHARDSSEDEFEIAEEDPFL